MENLPKFFWSQSAVPVLLDRQLGSEMKAAHKDFLLSISKWIFLAEGLKNAVSSKTWPFANFELESHQTRVSYAKGSRHAQDFCSYLTSRILRGRGRWNEWRRTVVDPHPWMTLVHWEPPHWMRREQSALHYHLPHTSLISWSPRHFLWHFTQYSLYVHNLVGLTTEVLGAETGQKLHGHRW